jgi:hypothetical protein
MNRVLHLYFNIELFKDDNDMNIVRDLKILHHIIRTITFIMMSKFQNIFISNLIVSLIILLYCFFLHHFINFLFSMFYLTASLKHKLNLIKIK